MLKLALPVQFVLDGKDRPANGASASMAGLLNDS
jgi:hypothetical protein